MTRHEIPFHLHAIRQMKKNLRDGEQISGRQGEGNGGRGIVTVKGQQEEGL